MAEPKSTVICIRVDEELKELLEKRAENQGLNFSDYVKKTLSLSAIQGGLEQKKSSVVRGDNVFSHDELEGVKFFGKHYKMLVRNLLGLKIDSEMFADKYLTQDELSYLDDCYEERFDSYGIKKPCESEA